MGKSDTNLFQEIQDGPQNSGWATELRKKFLTQLNYVRWKVTKHVLYFPPANLFKLPL